MGKYVTITEIAKSLNLSHSTVSRALNNHSIISLKTRQLVNQAAAEMGYRSSVKGNLLKAKQSHLIGLIVPDLSLHFFSSVVTHIEETLAQHGYSVLLFHTAENVEKEIMAVEKSLDYRVDGIIAATTVMTKHFAHFEKVLKHDIPMVFYDRVANFLPVPKVISNDYEAAFKATAHLIDSGCRWIGHITGSINLNNSNNRLYGYLDALKSRNIEVREDLVHYYDFKPETIRDYLIRTLQKHPQLDGLFTFNDYVANYAVNVLQSLGKAIPREVSVVGFSDEPVARYMKPTLSTIEEFSPQMGQIAAQKLLSILDGTIKMIDEKIVLNQGLVIRESTR